MWRGNMTLALVWIKCFLNNYMTQVYKTFCSNLTFNKVIHVDNYAIFYTKTKRWNYPAPNIKIRNFTCELQDHIIAEVCPIQFVLDYYKYALRKTKKCVCVQISLIFVIMIMRERGIEMKITLNLDYIEQKNLSVFSYDYFG